MIALLGGTFDPVHHGHLQAALAAAKALACPVHLVLAASPPNRPPPQAGVDHRWALLKLACADHPELQADDVELHRRGMSYTVDTLAAIRKEHPDEALCWIIGVDAFNQLHTWRNWPRLFNLAHLALLPRPGATIAEPLRRLYERLKRNWAGNTHGGIQMLEGEMLSVSASNIRNLAAAGADFQHLLPNPVHAYIKQHALYLGSAGGTSDCARSA